MTAGILFKQEMRDAIKQGRKTVTRRLDGLHEINKGPDRWVGCVTPNADGVYLFLPACGGTVDYLAKPRYHAGQELYVKETWRIDAWDDEGGQFRIGYRSGGFSEWLCVTDKVLETYWMPNAYWPEPQWRSPMMQPAAFARDLILIKDVRPERLQAITEEDAVREGCVSISMMQTARLAYAELWDSINGEGSWATSPWCWRYEFERVTPTPRAQKQ